MLPLDYFLFEKLAYHFLSISNSLEDGWYIEKHDNHNGDELILRKKFTTSSGKKTENEREDGAEINDFHIQDEFSDDECHDHREMDFITWDYHIVFSESFCIPVLYFNVSDSNGKTLSLDSLSIERKSNFGIITQQMHPIFNYPFYYIHPCDMATNEEWFKLAQMTRTNALVTWLSTVATIVKLKVFEEYSQIKFDYGDAKEQEVNFKFGDPEDYHSIEVNAGSIDKD